MILPLLAALALEGAPMAPPPRELAPGVHLLPGGFEPGRGPDGNTIVFDAPDGLVVVDTGRHTWHSDAILAFAGARGRPIAAIVNTHWHLDHSSGNRRIKAAFPNARLFTTNAVDRALGPDGFLTTNLARTRERLLASDVPAIEREEREIFVATMQESNALRPDIALSETRRMRLAGRRFDVHVTQGAVSDADVWLYDRRTRVVVLGDLVTFPAPFFETACPDQWRAELDAVWATPFRIAIPGHGAPMTRDQFNMWRAAYGAFIDCVNSDSEAATCASRWVELVTPLAAVGDIEEAQEYAIYYVGYLRENGGKSPTCLRR
jgi:glyoxylase-like metal-dependent hydrolase (beta-lactamase superfamily II)